ncbi:hypothetical protein KR51_00002250 [Rubidibacter lacunae KORDI 51-2]|uniref:Uncharacterized protein n=1 Tax=Rubidibacter lacunae KORDI 51-2 TaxID=582515 RepID=U5DTB7_9CHRO|nr:hypothetical protein [Rubidibacter lacunae]ERN42925.1 hypothetical protein KR51_00002250 [Rubidibacter lacunae KORDI 51-2]
MSDFSPTTNDIENLNSEVAEDVDRFQEALQIRKLDQSALHQTVLHVSGPAGIVGVAGAIVGVSILYQIEKSKYRMLEVGTAT